MAVLVKGLKNGPLEISGAVTVLDYRQRVRRCRRSGLSLSLRPIKEQTLLRWQRRSRRLQLRRDSCQKYNCDGRGKDPDAWLNYSVVVLILMGINLDFGNGRCRYGYE
jgi:hypothetical protein